MKALTSNKIKSYPLQIDERCIKRKSLIWNILLQGPVESAHPRRKNTILVTKQQHNANTAGLIKLHRPHFPNFATSSAEEQQTPILGCWSSEICAPFRWRYIHGVTSTLAPNALDTVMHTALQTVGNLYHTLHKLIWQRNKQSSYLHQLRWILCMSFMGPSAFHSSVEGWRLLLLVRCLLCIK